jgi:uncharacterized SAM-binding protein YcdF (DUF218 family)
MWKDLLLPPLNLFVLAAVLAPCVAANWRRLRWAIGILAMMAYLQTAPITATTLLVQHQTYAPVDVARLKDADATAIVVLGAGLAPRTDVDDGIRLGALALVRATYAADLQRATGLPLLVTGGRGPNRKRSVAEVMRARLQAWGVPVSFVEPRARNTWENATRSAEILQRAEIDRAVVVTHAWHMPRAMQAFHATSLDTTPAPTDFARAPALSPGAFVPSKRAAVNAYYGLYELFGRVYYKVAHG